MVKYQMKKFFFTIILLLLSMFLFSAKSIQAQNKVTVYVDPSSIVGEEYVPGGNITVYVRVEDVPETPGVCGAQFRLEWDGTVLKGVKLEIPAGHFMDPGGVEAAEGNLWIISKKVYDDHAEYAVTYYDIEAAKSRGTAPRHGNGTLAKITLDIVGIGETTISLKETILADETATPLETITNDGHFDNTPPPVPAHVYVDPPRIVDPALTPCHNFTVNITIENATTVYNYTFKLSYDATILNLVNATVGNFFPFTAMFLIETNDTLGYVKFTVWLTPPELPVSGNGTLASITFHVKALGSSVIHITDLTLLDEKGNQLPYTKEDGIFNNVLIGKLYVDPPEIIDPTMLPPSWFTINITVDDVEDMYHYDFVLNYDTTILTCYGAIILPDLNGIRPSGFVTFNDTAGIVSANVTFNPPASPITTYSPMPLLTLYFQVDSIGWTDLDLNNTHLTDSYWKSIPHETTDGYFMTLIRDVAVIDLVANETEVYPGWFVSINITVENQGDILETFNVEIYYDSNLITTITVVDLMPNASIILSILWNTTKVQSCNNYTISAHIPQVPFELDTTDNVYIDGKVKIRIPGDINGDDKVDILDCIIASNSFGSTPSDPEWNRYADLNRDNRVNILDMIKIALNFGKPH